MADTPSTSRTSRARWRDAAFPTVTVWNRLEGRPRTRGLRARAARRGPRRAVDARAPVAARRVPRRRCRLARLREAPHRHDASSTRYRPGRRRGASRSPTRCRWRRVVERGRVPFTIGARRWPSTCAWPWAGAGWSSSTPIADYADAFRRALRSSPPDPGRPRRRCRCRAPRGVGGGCRGRRPRDGRRRAVRHLQPAPGTTRTTASPGSTERPRALDDAAARFVAWFADLIEQPPADGRLAARPAGVPLRRAPAPDGGGERCSAPTEYHGRAAGLARLRRRPRRGRRRRPTVAATPPHGDRTRTVVPVPGDVRGHAEPALVGVRGRPDELRRRVAPTTTDLAKLLFLRVRAGVRQRLVPDAVRPAGRHARARCAACA